MSVYESTLWQAAVWVLFVCAVGHPFVTFGRLRAVKGTARRYVLATVQRTLMYPALAYWMLCIPVDLTRGRLHLAMVPADGLVCVLVMVSIAQLRSDDDDDWYKRIARRLKRWLRSVTASQVALPHIA